MPSAAPSQATSSFNPASEAAAAVARPLRSLPVSASGPSAGSRPKHPPPLQTWLHQQHDQQILQQQQQQQQQQQYQRQQARQQHPMISPPSSSFPPGFTTAPVSGHPLGLFGFLRVALADPNASYGYVDCNVPSNPTLWLAYVLVLSHNVLSLLSFSAFHPSPSSPSYSPTVDGPVVTLGDTPEDSIHIDHATSFRLGVAAAPLTGPTLIVDTNIPSNRVRWVFRCHTHHSLPPPSGLESMRSITSLESWLAVLRGKSLLSRRSRSVDTGLSSAAATPTSLASAGVADYSQGRAGMRRTSESSSNNFWPGIREREALPPAPKSAGSSVGLWLRRKKSRETLPRENLTRSNSAKPAVPRSSMETAPATRVVNPPRPPQQQQQQSAPHQKAYPQQPMPQEQQLSAFTNLPPPLSAMPSFNGNRMYQYSPSLGSANFPMATAPTTAHGPSSGILPTVPIAPKADYYTSIAARMMRKYSSDPPSDRENTITNQPGLPSNHSTSSTSLSTLPPAHSRNETPTSSASQPSSVSRYNTAPPSLQSGTSSALTSPASTAVFTTRQPSPASEVDDGTLTRQKWSDDEDRFLRLMYQQDAYALLDRMPTTPIPLLPPPRKQSADGFKSAPARLAGPAPPQATVSLPEPFQFKPPSTPYLSAAQTPKPPALGPGGRAGGTMTPGSESPLPGSPFLRVRSAGGAAPPTQTASFLSTASNRASFGSHLPASADPDLDAAPERDVFAANVREIVERRREGRDGGGGGGGGDGRGLDALVAAGRGRQQWDAGGREEERYFSEEGEFRVKAGGDGGGEGGGRRPESTWKGKEKARKVDIPRRSTSLMPKARAALQSV